MRFKEAICLSTTLLFTGYTDGNAHIVQPKDAIVHAAITPWLSACLAASGFIDAWTETEYGVWKYIGQPVYMAKRDYLKGYPATEFYTKVVTCRKQMD